MSPKTAVVCVLALVCGIAATIGVKSFMTEWENRLASRPAEKIVEKAKTAPVIVAKTDLPRGKVVSKDQVETREWPAELIPTGATSDIAHLVNRAVLSTVSKGEPILEHKLAKGSRVDLASALAAGMRAYTIHLPTMGSGVAGFILPGNKVDVLLTVTDLPKEQSSGPVTVTLLQAVEILAVDQQLEAPVDNKIDPKELRSVTLAVTPGQAAKLALGGTKGQLSLTLRNDTDGAGAVTDPVTLADLQFLQELPITQVTAMKPAEVVPTDDTPEIDRAIKELVPEANVRVRKIRDSVVLTGTAPTAKDVALLVKVAEQYYPSKVMNQIEIPVEPVAAPPAQVVAAPPVVLHIRTLKGNQHGVASVYPLETETSVVSSGR